MFLWRCVLFFLARYKGQRVADGRIRIGGHVLSRPQRCMAAVRARTFNPPVMFLVVFFCAHLAVNNGAQGDLVNHVDT